MLKKMYLSELNKGEKAKVIKVEDPLIEEKLHELGFITGDIVEIYNIAPLKDPIIISFSKNLVGLRKQEAAKISIERI